jgi:glycosyltransferase involved in cell wall biosynthesis
VQFAGWLPHEQLNALMGLTTAHVYLTYPFVLSWSLLEAMAAEALVIGSDTAPVRDVITHDRNGVLVDFFRPDLLADALIRAVRDPEAFRPLRRQARMDVLTGYDRETVCLPRWLDLIDRVRAGAA